jgi:hypothetical protein
MTKWLIRNGTEGSWWWHVIRPKHEEAINTCHEGLAAGRDFKTGPLY